MTFWGSADLAGRKYMPAIERACFNKYTSKNHKVKFLEGSGIYFLKCNYLYVNGITRHDVNSTET